MSVQSLIVRLHDGREVEAKVTKIVDSVLGRKVHIAFGAFALIRRVSTTLRHMLTEFSEFFHINWTGLLIHAWVGTAGGLGALRTKRSG
jgi:hypothetical protein